MSKLNHQVCIDKLSQAFSSLDHLEQYHGPSLDIVTSAREGFPLLASMTADMSPDATEQDTIGMVAALSAGYEALMSIDPAPFGAEPPNQYDLAEVDTLLVEKDAELRGRVQELFPHMDTLFEDGLSIKHAGFLIGVCVMVEWVDTNAEMSVASDVSTVAEAERPPSFEEELQDSQTLPSSGPEVSAIIPTREVSFRDALAHLMEVTDRIEITSVGKDVLLVVGLSDRSVDSLAGAAVAVRDRIPIKHQYINASPTGDIQLVSVLR